VTVFSSSQLLPPITPVGRRLILFESTRYRGNLLYHRRIYHPHCRLPREKACPRATGSLCKRCAPNSSIKQSLMQTTQQLKPAHGHRGREERSQKRRKVDHPHGEPKNNRFSTPSITSEQAGTPSAGPSAPSATLTPLSNSHKNGDEMSSSKGKNVPSSNWLALKKVRPK
jgi:hypothetical protein